MQYPSKISNNVLRLLVTQMAMLVMVSHSVKAVGTDDFYGIECYKTYNATEASRFVDLGVRWVRLWVDVPENWTPAAPTATINAAQAFKNHGFKVLIVFNFSLQSHATSGSRTVVSAYFSWLLNNTSLAAVTDVWEIGNEVGYSKYWKGTLAQYVNEVLRGAYEILAPAGHKVAGGCLDAFQRKSDGTYAYGMSQAQELMALNFKQYLHYISAHIYRKNPNEMITSLDGFLTTYNVSVNDPQPLLITEWNFLNNDFRTGTGFDLVKWSDYLARVKPYLYSQATQGKLRTAFYYRATEITGEGGWPGLMKNNSNKTPQEPLYTQYKNWAKYPASHAVVPRTLGTSADAYTSFLNPSTNYGSGGQVRVLGGTYDPKTGYLKFNLAGIQNIGSARLRLYGGRLSGSGNIALTARHVLDSSWSESTITHNNRPTSLGLLQDRPRDVNAAGWVVWDVTGAAELQAGSSVTIQLTQSSTAETFYHSKENGTNQPQLIVETLEDAGQRIFLQDFAAGGAPSDYVSSTPNAGQFTYIGQTGGAWSINNQKLRFVTSGNVFNFASVVRRANFNGPPQVLLWEWRMSVGNNTLSTTNALEFYLGSNLTNSYGGESFSNRWAWVRFGLGAAPGTFTLAGQSFSGTQPVRWLANASASAVDYTGYDGQPRSLPAQRYDLWVGSTLVISAASPDNPGTLLQNFKIRTNASYKTFSLELDDLEITSF